MASCFAFVFFGEGEALAILGMSTALCWFQCCIRRAKSKPVGVEIGACPFVYQGGSRFGC